MSLLDIALRFADYKPQPFVAPIPTNGIVDVFTLQNNVPLRYVIRNQKIGWYEINPGRRNMIGREAYMNETEEYLNALPRFYAIVGVPSGENSWLVFPYNASDAAQRGWKNGEPKQVYLVSEKIEPFDVIVIRNLAGTMLYQGVDYRLGEQVNSENLRGIVANGYDYPARGSWGNAYTLVSEWRKKAEQDAFRVRLKTQTLSATERMKFMLEFMGASLVSAEKHGQGYVVVWTAPDGHTYKMGVKEDGRISVAGFCLNGTDSQHNLSSIVQVMEEAQQRERPDVHRAYANDDTVEYEDDDD
jgi:hypothetical protein